MEKHVLDRDDAVRGTNEDALTSKHSAVTAGYLQDPYIKAFLKRGSKRAPIINRGTYARTAGLDILIKQFLIATIPLQDATGSEIPGSGTRPMDKQIISLGAGSDTRFFNFKADGINPRRYIEIDYPQITAKKAHAIVRDKNTRLVIGEDSYKVLGGGVELVADSYWLIPGDLRDFTCILPKLVSMGLDTTLPTLILSECVLIYLDPIVSHSILTTMASSFTTAVVATYEQILPNDAFGITMLNNLKTRNITLPGIHDCQTLEHQISRYIECGWTTSRAINLNTVWDKCISDSEKLRVSKLEIFDEIEEWQLLSMHYCISWAVKLGHANDDMAQTYVDKLWFKYEH
ncbi:carboxy methyl transferase for protein phosphatase 2A [Batrachochytrium dendrobatidis]|nr:carboxy methyl transferase for protein phosphatase 2A [Batrachochytrium dendrobatidis]